MALQLPDIQDELPLFTYGAASQPDWTASASAPPKREKREKRETGRPWYSESDGLAQQQDGAAPGAGLRVEDEQAVDGAGPPVGHLGAGALQREAVVLDAAQRGAQI